MFMTEYEKDKMSPMKETSIERSSPMKSFNNSSSSSKSIKSGFISNGFMIKRKLKDLSAEFLNAKI